MKSVLLAITLIFGANCGKQSSSATGNHANVAQSTPQRLEAAKTPAQNEVATVSKEKTKDKEVPFAFRGTDFKNFSYPTSPRMWVRLKDGRFENSDGIGGSTVEFKDVNYVDLNGDGNRDALVHLVQVICGGSCDGGSDSFYFYGMKKDKPTLMSRIESGSLGYGCGLKSFTVNNQQVTLEVFWKCHKKGSAIEADNDSEEIGKFDAKSFTRFLFRFKGNRLALAKREILPYAEGDVRGYRPVIKVSDD